MNTSIIDVSYHNGTIDFEKVKNDGIKGVIIRAGFGQSNVDKKFIDNIKGAIAAGLHIGIYWFMYGGSNAAALMNAKKCVETIQSYKNYIDLGVFSDWEYDSDEKAPGQTKASRTEFVQIFNEYIEKEGFEAGTYTNLDYFRNKFDMWLLKKWPVWIAQYSNALSRQYLEGYNVVMWQYSSKGSVAGIKGNVDLNEYYGQLSDMESIKTVENAGNSGNKQEEYKMPTIRKGSVGKAVRIWQVIVGTDVDGDFGQKTLEATRSFQQKHGLSVDGIVGPKSWKAGLESV